MMGIIVAGATAVGMLAWLIYDCFNKDGGFSFGKDELKRIINIVIYAITIVVMAVPEGLPLAVTLSLAYSVAKMKDENNLVRQLDCIFPLGSPNSLRNHGRQQQYLLGQDGHAHQEPDDRDGSLRRRRG